MKLLNGTSIENKLITTGDCKGLTKKLKGTVALKKN